MLKKKLHYLLSASEYGMPGCYMMLKSVIDDLINIDGIILYSFWLLPEIKTHRMKIYHDVLNKEKVLHFALEDLRLAHKQHIEEIELLFSVTLLAKQSSGLLDRLSL